MLNIDKIKDVIADTIEKKRHVPSKCPCTLEDIPRLRRVSQKNKNRLSRFVSRIRSGNYSASDAAKDLEKDTIAEEKSVDIPDGGGNFSKSNTLMRQRAITKKSPRPERKNDEETNGDTSSTGLDVTTEYREIPGRRKPRQPEAQKLWQDGKCNSIDEGEELFFTAVSS